MAEDKDRIEQIRARRGRDAVQLTSTQTGTAGPSGGGIGQVSAGLAQESVQDVQALLGVDFKSPWLRDRVTLSLEAQISMIEQRANYRVNMADLGYTNRISVLPVRPGIFVKIEPTGCYRMVYHNR
ncbi:MAG: hypothetical protein FJX76_00715 [Armatimonadetes bacterium]|nr:hypothetical protein [Armatimonadota bacterium]